MKVLLHICCAPCLVAFDKYFNQEKIEYGGFFYNPNIHPYAEFSKRLEALKNHAEQMGIDVIYDPQFDQITWEESFKNTKVEKRCKYCYTRRINKTAQAAAENQFSHFTTTLLISPYQNHEMIIDLSEKAAIKYEVEFYYHDFRKYFREGQKTSREMEMYRQKYCGCIYSYRESKFRDKINWD